MAVEPFRPEQGGIHSESNFFGIAELPDKLMCRPSTTFINVEVIFPAHAFKVSNFPVIFFSSILFPFSFLGCAGAQWKTTFD